MGRQSHFGHFKTQMVFLTQRVKRSETYQEPEETPEQTDQQEQTKTQNKPPPKSDNLSNWIICQFEQFGQIEQKASGAGH